VTDRQTNRWSDGRTQDDSIYRARIASRGKKGKVHRFTDVDGQCDKVVTETVTSFHTDRRLTDRPLKLTAPEISGFRDMVGAHQNLNGSHDLTRPFQG